MTFWQDVAQFISANKASIIVSVVVGLIFFVLGPMGVWFSGRRIRRERIRKAKDSIVDLLEGMLVSQEEVTPEKLNRLFAAVEREIDVSLGGVYDIDLLTEDVMLRFERSKHLDAQQKQQYFAKLAEVRTALHAQREPQPERPLPRREREIIDELRSKTSGDQALAPLIDELQERLERRPELTDPILAPFLFYSRIIRKRPKVFLLFFLVYLIVVTVFVLIKGHF